MMATRTDGSGSSSCNNIHVQPQNEENDKRWCKGGAGRLSEYGVVGAEQYDESYFDDRSNADDDLEKGQIKFAQDKLYGRDEELSTLLSIYDKLSPQRRQPEPTGTSVVIDDGKSSSSSSQIVFIGGYSGVGKSSLVKQFFKTLKQRQRKDEASKTSSSLSTDCGSKKQSKRRTRLAPWIVSGKFDELQSPYPYSAIASGINSLCSDLVSNLSPSDEEEEEIQAMVDSLDQTDYRILSEIFPGLALLMNAFGDNNNNTLSRNSTHERHPYYNRDRSRNETSDTKSISETSGSSHTRGTTTGAEQHQSQQNGRQQHQPQHQEQPLTSSSSASVQLVKDSFRNLIKALTMNKDRPLVVFIDDLQWSDPGSLDLLSVILHDASLGNFMFIGSYRSNDVKEDSAVMSLMNQTGTMHRSSRALQSSCRSLENLNGDSNKHNNINSSSNEASVHRMDMSDLTQQQICDFIADTLDLDDDEVQPLVEAIYSKTLGNIFFTMQALEELVRKNALFYDMMFFKWEWNLSKVELENLLSDDVVEMVQTKIGHMPSLVQKSLITAAYTRSTFDVDTLRCLLVEAQGMEGLCKDELIKALDQAVLDGLLFNVMGNDQYSFAHDRIQEAASSFVSGECRDLLCLRIGQVLIRRGTLKGGGEDGVGEDWMLFVGIHHINSLPTYKANDQRLDCGFTKHELANLNLKAARLAVVKSAFSQAVKLIRAGVQYLDKETQWTEQYDLCLEMRQALMENEFIIGNHELAQVAADEILANVNSLRDRCLAQAMHLEVLMKCRKYADGVPVGLQYLAQHGVRIPSNPGKAHSMKEKLRLQVVSRNRKLEEIVNLPEIDEYGDAIMKLMLQLALCAGMVNGKLLALVATMAQRFTWEMGKNKHLPVILSVLTTALRMQNKLKVAYNVGCTALELLKELCVGAPLCKGLNLVAGCVMLLNSPFSDALEKLNESYRVGLEAGDIEWRLLSAMQYCHMYFCTGWPTGATLEPKIILYEEEAIRLCQPPSVTITFCIFRQTLLNLQGRGNKDPVVLKGCAVDEDLALAQFDGSNRKQTQRDFGIYRLMLACIFEDDATQKDMVDLLMTYPDFDFSIPREHLRDTFIGLAAFAVGRKHKDKKYIAIGRQKKQKFQRLAKIGSANVAPVVVCFKAMESPSVGNFNEAVDICSREGLLHLQAMMNEHCGLYLLERNKGGGVDESEAKRYLTRAMWIYYDWGAMGKVGQMRQRHHFLQGSRRSEKTPNGLLEFMARAAANGGGGGQLEHSPVDDADRSRSSYTYSLTVTSESASVSGVTIDNATQASTTFSASQTIVT